MQALVTAECPHTRSALVWPIHLEQFGEWQNPEETFLARANVPRAQIEELGAELQMLAQQRDQALQQCQQLSAQVCVGPLLDLSRHGAHAGAACLNLPPATFNDSLEMSSLQGNIVLSDGDTSR